MEKKTIESFAPTILRIGLGLTFLLIGIDQILHLQNWIGYLAPWAQNILATTPEQFFFYNAIFDITLGGLLLLGILTRLLAVVAFLHLIGVIANIGYNEIAIRDLGLLFAALALACYRKTQYVLIRR